MIGTQIDITICDVNYKCTNRIIIQHVNRIIKNQGYRFVYVYLTIKTIRKTSGYFH